MGPSRPSGRVRLQRVLAAAGVASRRAAERLIEAGRVSVNGEPASLGDSADPARDTIALDGEPLQLERPVYWLVHKPRGVLTTVRDPEGRQTVLDLLPARVSRTARVFPVGRLDRDTEGLVLLTNDGALTHALLHPSHEVEREYVVTVRGALGAAEQRRLAGGVRLEDGLTARARVEHVRHDRDTDTTTFHLTLVEGRKRQIRRAMRALGHPVRSLLRIRMGPLRLGTLAPGAARRVTPAERRALERLARAPGDPADAQAARRSGPKPAPGQRKRGRRRGPR